MSKEKLQALLQGQFGVATRGQILELGISAKELERHVHKGTWVRIHPSVFALAAASRKWPWSLMAAQLWSGAKAVVSHHSAAALHGLEDFSEEAVELSGTRALTAPPGVTYHHVRRLPEADLTKTRGIRLTTVARTLLDLSSAVSPTGFTERQLERAFDEALRRRMVKLDVLRWCLERNRAKGRETALFETLLAIREKYGETRSPLESDFAHLLRIHQLEEAHRSHRVLSGNRFLAEVDFAWPERKLCVQVHGAETHTKKEIWNKDQSVENQLQLAGWKVIKITHEMLKKPEGLAKSMRNALATPTPPSAAAPARSR